MRTMKTRKSIFFYAFIAHLSFSTYAAEVPGLKVIDCTVEHKGDLIDLNLLLDASQISISPNEQLEISPVLIGKSDTLRLSPLLFTGNIRSKINHRLERINKQTSVNYANYNMKQLTESGRARITYTRQIPFRDWMYGSRLILQNTVTGCAECQRNLPDIPLAYIPRKLAVNYIVPRPELKTRHKNVSLYLHFPQNESSILPAYKNNYAELAKADSLIAELTGDEYIIIDSIKIVGYASPEGRYSYNTRLSGNRAKALKEYLEEKFTPQGNVLTIINASEDWAGLRKHIEKSDLVYRTQLLSIIDSVPDPDTRDNYIRRLDRSITYANLLQNLYPLLRRVVCQANYIIKPFTTEQAKQRLTTNPEQLSLNEMYLIAQSYPTGSPRFNELFAQMLFFYPNNTIAKNNLAAVALNAGDTKRAKTYLESMKQLPEIQNNLGILLYQEGKISEAKQCFEKACACGCKEAIYNLQEINTLLATQ